MTAHSAGAAATRPADSKDHTQQAPSCSDSRANGASIATEEGSASSNAVAAGWAAVDTWGGARTRSGRFARSPDKGTVSSGTDEAVEAAGSAVVTAGAAVPASPLSDPRQAKAVVPQLWQASVEPAFMTTAAESPLAGKQMAAVGGEVRHAEGGNKADSAATSSQRAPTVDGWVARPARSRPAEPRPMIPRVASLAPGPSVYLFSYTNNEKLPFSRFLITIRNV